VGIERLLEGAENSISPGARLWHRRAAMFTVSPMMV